MRLRVSPRVLACASGASSGLVDVMPSLLRAVLPWAALLLSLNPSVALPDGASPRATPVVGRLQLAPEGLETSRLGIGALHFPELGCESSDMLAAATL